MCRASRASMDDLLFVAFAPELCGNAKSKAYHCAVFFERQSTLIAITLPAGFDNIRRVISSTTAARREMVAADGSGRSTGRLHLHSAEPALADHGFEYTFRPTKKQIK